MENRVRKLEQFQEESRTKGEVKECLQTFKPHWSDESYNNVSRFIAEHEEYPTDIDMIVHDYVDYPMEYVLKCMKPHIERVFASAGEVVSITSKGIVVKKKN